LAELGGLARAIRVLEAELTASLAECLERKLGVSAVARVLGVHRSTIYRTAIWHHEVAGPEEEAQHTL
jgi:transposase-like protein